MRNIQKLFITVFFGFCGIIGILTLDNDIAKSDIEKRELSVFPDLKLKRLVEDRYLNNITNAFSDQVQFRGAFVQNNFKFLHNILNQNYLNTTVVGKENYLFREPEIISDWSAYETELKKCAELINKEAKKVREMNPDCKFIYINYPRKDLVMQKYLPSTYPSSVNDYNKAISILKRNLSNDVIMIDAYEVFKRAGVQNECYYRSDHHVNEIGQQEIYEELMRVIQKYSKAKIPVYTLNDYNMREVMVAGSFDSQIGNILKNEKPKEFMISSFKKNISFVRYDNGKKKDSSLFKKQNDYLTYMGGDIRETLIKTQNKDLPTVLYTGSSYTNLLETLTVPSVGKMIAVDYRYGQKEKTLPKYIKKYNVDYCILVPNQSDQMFSYEALKTHLGK